MAIPLVPLPPYPTVPNAPGVPQLLNADLVPALADDTSLPNSDAFTDSSANQDAVWGVFDANNQPAFTVDTYMMLSPSNKTKQSDFPTEQGGFTSFNKVQTPYTVKIRVSLAGSLSQMQDLLTTFKTLSLSTDFLSVVTPMDTYTNCTLVDFKYEQTARKGAGRIEADLSFEEAREVSAAFTNVTLPAAKVKNPGSAATSDSGKQQGAPTSVLSSGVNSVSNWLKK